MTTAAVALTTATTTTCLDRSCQAATSHPDTCDCRCGGASHGIEHLVGRLVAVEAFKARSVGGFTPAMLAANNDDEPW